MKRLISVFAVMACAVSVFAQQTFAATGLYSFKTKSFQSVVLAPKIAEFDIGSLWANVPDTPQVSFLFDIHPLVGVDENGEGTAGLAAMHAFPLTRSKAWNLHAGFFGRVVEHRPIVTGFLVGLSVQLNGP